MASVFDDIETHGVYRALTKAEVKSRMQKLVPQAFRTLESNLYSEDDKVSTMAAVAILDRCGYGPQSKITVEDEREDLTTLSTEELKARALALAYQLDKKDPPMEDEPFSDSVH